MTSARIHVGPFTLDIHGPGDGCVTSARIHVGPFTLDTQV